MKKHLQKKTALITGASTGVGKALAETFCGYNMKLGLLARSPEKLKTVAEHVTAAGSEALILSADLRDRKAVENAALQFKNKFGVPDFLINNAGIGYRGFWSDISLQSELDVMTVNYTAPVILIRSLLPDMLKAGKGHIININSIAGLYAAPYQSAYCASKSALLAYSECLAYELENIDVHITTVFPGPIDTDFLNGKNFENFRNSSDMVSPKNIAEIVLSAIRNPEERVFVGPTWKPLAVKIANLYPRFFRKLIEKKNKPPEKLKV